MEQIQVTDRAALLINHIRMAEEQHKAWICEAMTRVVNVIRDEGKANIPYEDFHTIGVLAEYADLVTALSELPEESTK